MRRYMMTCLACTLLVALLGATGLHQKADASLPDRGIAASVCDLSLADGVDPTPGAGGDSEEQLPAFAQTLPQNGCTQCKDGKKICCKGSECRTVKC